MDKTSYRVLTITVSCLLFLLTTAERVIAWPCTSTSCPDCETCRPTGCECLANCGCDGRTCPEGYFCVLCGCMCGSECCDDSDCSLCEECVDFECQFKEGNDCANTLDCPFCHDCIDCDCIDRCAPDECCDESTDTCVDKCNPDGGPCTWTYPAIESGCPVQDISGDLRCVPGEEGKTCLWYVKETYHTTSAKCANCAPGCSDPDGDSCVLVAARICKYHLVVGCVCTEVEEPPTTKRGAHYVCN